jgi:dienelactone hydrolase
VADELEDMLARFEAFDPTTKAREVCRQLIAQGWHASTPKSRGGRPKSDTAYVRFTYRGPRGQVVLYLNTEALVSDGQTVREFVSALPHAEVRKSAVRFRHSDDLDQAVAAADSLRRWAAGEVTA